MHTVDHCETEEVEIGEYRSGPQTQHGELVNTQGQNKVKVSLGRNTKTIIVVCCPLAVTLCFSSASIAAQMGGAVRHCSQDFHSQAQQIKDHPHPQ